MKIVNRIDLVSTLYTDGALYSIVPEKNGTFLLGLGLWDRINSPHTLGIKDATKGQVIRIDWKGRVLAKSPELSNLIYQIVPVDEEKIFVGCRNGDLQYLNKNLEVQRKISLENSGLYFLVREKDTIVATMREGAVLYFNLNTEESEIVQVVDKDIRMWSIMKDGDKYLAGSYRGHLAVIVNKKVEQLKTISPQPSAIWTLDKFNSHYLAGTALGELLMLDENLNCIDKVFQCDTGITASARLNKQQLVLSDLKGNLHILDERGSIIHYTHPIEEKLANTVWWITPDHENSLLRVAYSNGQMRKFRLD